jgi:nicotinate-nucleotide adenylyltransferase
MAHRRITLFAMPALGLGEVWWLVSPGNPLKAAAGMAPLATRVRSARALAKNAPIRVSAIERELGTRYTADTLRALKRLFPRRRFVWLMGADNLAQFHRWKNWRRLAREMPIAVIARPGYDDRALASPAMAWLRRYRLTAARFRNRHEWSAPALIELRFDPDPRSATKIRRADPDWAGRFGGPSLRDGVTHSLIHDPAKGAGA